MNRADLNPIIGPAARVWAESMEPTVGGDSGEAGQHLGLAFQAVQVLHLPTVQWL